MAIHPKQHFLVSLQNHHPETTRFPTAKEMHELALRAEGFTTDPHGPPIHPGWLGALLAPLCGLGGSNPAGHLSRNARLPRPAGMPAELCAGRSLSPSGFVGPTACHVTCCGLQAGELPHTSSSSLCSNQTVTCQPKCESHIVFACQVLSHCFPPFENEKQFLDGAVQRQAVSRVTQGPELAAGDPAQAPGNRPPCQVL